MAALPYYMGIKAKQTLDKQHALLQDSVFLEVVGHQYQRGWFSSEETTSVRLKPSVVAAYKSMLPESLRDYVGKTVTYTNHIYHGPFPRFQYFGRAYVETEFQFSAEVKNELTRFFKEQPPVVLRNQLNFSGGGRVNLTVPAFDYSELSGIKINWQGLNYSIDYQDEFSNYLASASAPGLTITLADKGKAFFKELNVHSDNRLGQTGASLGKNTLTLGQLHVSWSESVDYYINLNELVSMLSNVQVGAFINPRGKIGPAKLELNQLTFMTDVQEQGEFLSWNMETRFDQLAYDKDVYGPMQVKVAASHFEGKSFIALVNKLKEIATQNLDAQQAREAMITAAKTEGLGFLTNSPQINIESFKLQMPSGLLDVHGTFALNDVKAEELNDFLKLMRKVDINMEGYVPQAALESLAISNARAIFTPDERVEDQPDMDDIAQSVVTIVRGVINDWTDQGLVELDNGIVHSKIQRKDEHLYINGHKLIFEYEDEEALFQDDNASEEASQVQVSENQPLFISQEQ